MIGLVVFGVLSRTLLHIGPNIEFVTAISLISGFYLNNKYSWLIPLLIMGISDIIITNTSIYIFTWSSFLITWVIGLVLKSALNNKIFSKLKKVIGRTLFNGLAGETGGVLSTIVFFLWTNFGVVLMTNMYPKSIEGIMMSYAAGIPFLRPQLLANLVIIPSAFVCTTLLRNFTKMKLANNNTWDINNK